MDLSVIIPVYNTAQKDLSRCFTSLRFCEGITFEVILVDDGSRNETAEFCRDYAALHMGFHYYRQENRGVSAARNTGLSHACGRYVMFVDADDELIAETIRPCHLDGNWDLVFFDHEVREFSRTYSVRVFDEAMPAMLQKKDCLGAACRDRINSSCARLYRRAVLQEAEIRFPEDMVVAEDAAFVLEAILAAQTFHYVPTPVYRYFHSYENGDNRLMRYPETVLENSIQLYRRRNDALSCYSELPAFTATELDRLRADVAERLVRILFEAKGALLRKGNALAKMTQTVVSLSEELHQTYAESFSPATRLKCFLLKKDWKTVIRGCAYAREIYIRIK